MARKVTLGIAALAALIGLLGCTQRTDEPISPTSTSTIENAVGQSVLVILVPPDSGVLFNGVAKIAEGSGLPYTFQLMEGNSMEAGARAVLDGTVDLTLMMRRPRSDEPLAFLELFQTPVVVLVNADVGISDLTREQVARIFSGRATNWSQFGGPDLDIGVFVQEESDTTTIALREYLFSATGFSESGQMLYSDKDMIAVVGGLPGAIGYSAWATAKLYDASPASRSVIAVSINGKAPGQSDYPIISPIGLAYLAERQGFLQPLFDWIAEFLNSEMARLLMEQFGISGFTSTAAGPEGENDAHDD